MSLQSLLNNHNCCLRIKLTFLYSIIFIAGISRELFAQAGALDNSFGTNGKVTTAIGPYAVVYALALQPDKKIVAAGNSYNGFSIARYDSNGTLDNTFGTGGMVTLNMINTAGAYSVVIQQDGQIVVSGGGELEFILIRYNEDGTIDSSFDHDGLVFGECQGFVEYAAALALQPDGKIIAAGTLGYTLYPPYYEIALARFNVDGSLDSTFARINYLDQIGGYFFGGYDASAYDIALQPDGKIITVGVTDSDALGSIRYVAIARFKNDGTPDSTFGINGHVTTALGSSASAGCVALEQEGKIIVGGATIDSSGNYHGLLLRYNSDGSLDDSFGEGGIVTSLQSEFFNDVAIQQDDKILALGSNATTVFLIRYNPNGTPDTSFGINGVVTSSFGTNRSIVIQPDNKILTGGSSDGAFALARYLSGLNVGIIDLTPLSNSVFIYPNPLEQKATLKYTLKNQETISIRLLDAEGKEIKTFIESENEQAGEHQQEIVLPDNLSSGSYLIVISSASGGRVSIKVVK